MREPAFAGAARREILGRSYAAHPGSGWLSEEREGAFPSRMRALVDDPDGTIAFDRFHIVAHMNDAVEALRIDGDGRLVGSRNMWLYGEENLAGKYELDFVALRSADLKTARAWAIKESLRQLWTQRSGAAGERWYGWAVRSRLEPVKKVAAMIERHLPNVLTYFKHRITTPAARPSTR